jgi:hypothetical protein
MPEPTVLSRRALNRATLARQMLLRREDVPVTEAIERIGGMQAQTPHSWYVGLWARIEGFRPEQAAELLVEREIVRIALMRGTIHLVTARDCLEWRPLVDVVIERGMKGVFGRDLVDIDREALIAAGRTLVDEEPRTFHELGKLLAEQWPDRNSASLAQAIRAWVPLVQVPPRGVWGRSGPVAHTSVETWLGRSVTSEPSVDHLVLRCLAALGPASVKDVQAWSGLTRLREVVEQLRPQLVAFRDESGRELFDLPEAPRPDPDTPAPIRFMYDFDNINLSHDDRSRAGSHVPPPVGVFTEHGPLPGTVLIDGFPHCAWMVDQERGGAILKIQSYSPLSKKVEAEVSDEGARLLDFLAPDATHDIQFTELFP